MSEPWGPNDPEFKAHRIYCAICDNDGWPLKSAYRPHTLKTDCWCVRAPDNKANCVMAIEFGFAKPVAITQPPNILGMEASTWSISFVTDDELIETYRQSVEDLRNEARRGAQIDAYLEWSA